MITSAIKVVFFDIGNTLIANRAWMPQAKETIALLKKAGVRVGLISNTGDLDREELRKLLPADFDFEDFESELVLLSSEVSMEKPDLPIFLFAVQHAGVSPWETCFVAETVSETLGAQAAGMRAVRICDSAKDYPVFVESLLAK